MRFASRALFVGAASIGVAVLCGAWIADAQTVLKPEDMMQRAKKARELTQVYSERLKAGIVQALKEGGPKGCDWRMPHACAGTQRADHGRVDI